MLKFFNRLERTRNFVLLIFAVLMVASLVFFYAPTRNTTGTNLSRSEETVAKVSGETISVGEVYRIKDTYSRMMQGRPYPAKSVLQSLIGSRIARVEAARLGLTATDEEVAAEIREQNKPQDGKPFDKARYERNVTEQYGGVTAYEESVRDDISAKKLEAFITSGVTVSEEEVLNDFKKKNTKFDVAYVMVDPTELSKNITPTEEELRQYFEQNKASYYISVPQKKIRYIFINTAKIGEKLPISDEELRAEYDKLPEDKKKAGVLGQEIVLRVAKPEFEGQVSEKAAELVQRLKKDGDLVSEETFSNIAKGFSENPATAPVGGKLSGPVRENPNKPDDPYQRLLKMKPGEITEPISYQGRYFILRRGEDVPKPFEDARKELEVSLRNRKAYAVTAELAGKISEALKQSKDVQKTAQEFAAQANMNVADMVRETPYIKPGDNVDKVGVSPQFEEGIVGLENPQDVGDKIPVSEGFAIPLLVDKKEPRDADFAEVRPQIVEVVKVEKARSQLEQIAKEIAAGAASPAALSALAAKHGLKSQDQKAFIIGSPLGQGPTASTNETLENAVFALKDGEVTKEPIKMGEAYAIVGVTKREEASMDEFAKQRDQLFETMLRQKRSSVFADFMAEKRRELESAGKIVIYQDALAKLEEPLLPFGQDQ